MILSTLCNNNSFFYYYYYSKVAILSDIVKYSQIKHKQQYNFFLNKRYLMIKFLDMNN